MAFWPNGSFASGVSVQGTYLKWYVTFETLFGNGSGVKTNNYVF
jgi:hypothetical protein